MSTTMTETLCGDFDNNENVNNLLYQGTHRKGELKYYCLVVNVYLE